jgi:HPt (histidine-containing phosphotransfer) domain-containing protein
MPSSPTTTDDQPIDLQHLRQMTLGDFALEREVLGMFLAQTARPIGDLMIAAEPTALAHRLKGSARAIGAFRVAEGAGALERAIQGGANPSQILIELDHAVAAARAAIEAMLDRS